MDVFLDYHKKPMVKQSLLYSATKLM